MMPGKGIAWKVVFITQYQVADKAEWPFLGF